MMHPTPAVQLSYLNKSQKAKFWQTTEELYKSKQLKPENPGFQSPIWGQVPNVKSQCHFSRFDKAPLKTLSSTFHVWEYRCVKLAKCPLTQLNKPSFTAHFWIGNNNNNQEKCTQSEVSCHTVVIFFCSKCHTKKDDTCLIVSVKC